MSHEIADALNNIAAALWGVANSILPLDARPGTDATGASISSLTEAVMGVTAALASRDRQAIGDAE